MEKAQSVAALQNMGDPAMKYVLQIERIYENEGMDTELLGIFRTPEEAMKAFPRGKQWESYNEYPTDCVGYITLLHSRGTIMIYAYIIPVEENLELVDTTMFKDHFDV